jgi:hypothetical protein
MRRCPPDFQCLDDEQREFMTLLEGVLDRVSAFPEPVALYRGLTFTPPDEELLLYGHPDAIAARQDPQGSHDRLLAALEQAQKSGTAFSLPSFTSTSIDPLVAMQWAGGTHHEAQRGILFAIKARTGLLTTPWSSHSEEQEILQSPQTRFRVRAVGASTALGVEGSRRSIWRNWSRPRRRRRTTARLC